jgi:hypothetical protein
MKAMIWTKFGQPGVLQLQEVAKPAPIFSFFLCAAPMACPDSAPAIPASPSSQRLPVQSFQESPPEGSESRAR